MISIIFFIFTLLSSSDSFTPTKDIHLSCKKIFEYIYTVECQLPIDLQNSDIVRITSKNITTNLPLKIAASNMPDYFPQGIGQNFPEIEELRIWWSKLKFIDRESFTKFKVLKILDLIGNSIENIPTDTFYDLENVEEINLYKNHIKTLDADLLIKNTKLKKFSAGQNEIEEIPKGFFKNNLEINWIDLIKNKIKKIDIDFTEFVNLKTIGLSGNDGECNFNYGIKAKYNQTIDEFQEKVNLFCGN